MMFSLELWQLIAIVVACLVAWWATKQLVALFVMRHIEKQRYCVTCLDHGNGKLILNSPWTVKTAKDEMPIYLCNKCKREQFSGEVGQLAEKKGFIFRERQ